MPDTLNKQSIINLLIDSPLREPIKINLIDIVNNTNEPDLPKVYSTITKELEIFQKATERRMKLADETIAKLGGTVAESPVTAPSESPMPTMPTPPVSTPVSTTPIVETPVVEQPPATPEEPVLSVPPLDLPPMPPASATPADMNPLPPIAPAAAPAPAFQALGSAPMASSSDEDALAEIQKELDSLKNEAAADLSADKAGVAAAQPVTPPVQQ